VVLIATFANIYIGIGTGNFTRRRAVGVSGANRVVTGFSACFDPGVWL